MEETRSVKLDLSVAELKKSINELRDAIVAARATNKDYSETLSQMRAKQHELDEVMKIGKDDVAKYTDAMKAARAELKQHEAEMMKFPKYSKEWYEQAKAAGALRDNIQDARNAVKAYASDTRGLDNVLGVAKAGAAAFGLWTSALAAFGVENEEVVRSIQKLQAVTTALVSIQQIQNALTNKSVGLGWLWNKAMIAVGASTSTATVATNSFTAALGKVKMALVKTGIGALFVAAGAAIAYLISNFDKLIARFKSGKKEIEEVGKSFKDINKEAKDLSNTTLSNLESKYRQLQASWKSLSTEHQKKEWIKKNQTELKNLGLEVKNVNDAEKWMVEKSKDVITAFKLRAQAAAEAARMTALYAKSNEILDQATERQNLLKKREGDKASAKDFNEGRAKYDERSGEYQFTKEGAAEYNKELFKTDKILTGLSAQWDDVNDKIDKSANKYANLYAQIGSLTGSMSSAASSADDYLKTIDKAAAKEVEAAKAAREKLQDEAKLALAKKEITKKEYEDRLIIADKSYADELEKIAKKYEKSEETKTKLTQEAVKLRRDITIREATAEAEAREETFKKSNEAIKKSYEDTMNEIELEAKEAEIAAKQVFEQNTQGLDPNSEEYKAQEQILQDTLFQIRENARAKELEAENYFYNSLISLFQEYGLDTTDLEAALQQKRTDIVLKGVNDRLAAEKKGAKQYKKWSEKDTKEKLKTVSMWAESTTDLYNAVADIMMQNIQNKIDSGELSEEEAKKEFERQKALQYSMVWINTLNGIAGAWAQAFQPDVPLWTAIAMGAANSTTMLATGIAESLAIKNMKFGGGGEGGASAVPAVQDVQVAPLLNERQDSQDMTALNTAELAQNQINQRVYILQSDIEDSQNQVKTRVNQSTF